MTSPTDWPEGFPDLPGGEPLKAPAAGAVRVSILAYPGRMPKEVETDLRAELARAGWSCAAVKAGPEAIRFSTSKEGRSVSISIRDDGGRAILQVMQL